MPVRTSIYPGAKCARGSWKNSFFILLLHHVSILQTRSCTPNLRYKNTIGRPPIHGSISNSVAYMSTHAPPFHDGSSNKRG